MTLEEAASLHAEWQARERRRDLRALRTGLVAAGVKPRDVFPEFFEAEPRSEEELAAKFDQALGANLIDETE